MFREREFLPTEGGGRRGVWLVNFWLGDGGISYGTYWFLADGRFGEEPRFTAYASYLELGNAKLSSNARKKEEKEKEEKAGIVFCHMAKMPQIKAYLVSSFVKFFLPII